ncbi:MAG: hypothetical protein [Caudoviricetes sp.]|nr:MAG: hypothetical protein [Caudoviricetes sp.]
MNEIVGWIVGNTQSGPHAFRKKRPHGWQYSDGLVTHSYHKAEVARLRAELNAATKAGLDAIAAICEKEREADALRVDAERYRWLRNEAYKVDEMTPAVILAEAGFPVDDSRTDGFVFEDELDERVDAAMGEGK